jgi:hypothetical protein
MVNSLRIKSFPKRKEKKRKRKDENENRSKNFLHKKEKKRY